MSGLARDSFSGAKARVPPAPEEESEGGSQDGVNIVTTALAGALKGEVWPFTSSAPSRGRRMGGISAALQLSVGKSGIITVDEDEDGVLDNNTFNRYKHH
jgi:hypothetical protein